MANPLSHANQGSLPNLLTYVFIPLPELEMSTPAHIGQTLNAPCFLRYRFISLRKTVSERNNVSICPISDVQYFKNEVAQLKGQYKNKSTKTKTMQTY